ncbi:helix-turn-helix transcriptional regulator [Staphylococcus saprophyticus]|nr:helix-turn-helix transcriptional regulator [Staphylococcus saprophyticus]MDW3925677.1 helix-turn-helix transcriptional regulator [Staphylococcus saprophyticus]MDW4078297.1 helix-turn-helix transcriptional regulator [Staphylococcus saprophyticus]MDW4380495.1 helix-turn-helix transcriptional regulator [Staphylococcus saprophyticus]MDW4382493.1 helix-turn-helix transcriptional regulator [Staphylococcus saprophyticus]
MFSQNLKYLRNKHDMEQIDLAHKLGKKSASSISEWEKGKYTPKLKTLTEIAAIFHVSINDLMEEDLSKPKEEKGQDTIAAHFDKEDLTDEEKQEVQDFINYLKSKRK